MTYSLRHVGRTSDFDVPSAEHGTVHLLECQLSALGDFIFDESESFVLLRHWIPRHVDRLDWSEGKKSGADRVFFQLEWDASDVHSVGRRGWWIRIELLRGLQCDLSVFDQILSARLCLFSRNRNSSRGSLQDSTIINFAFFNHHGWEEENQLEELWPSLILLDCKEIT